MYAILCKRKIITAVFLLLLISVIVVEGYLISAVNNGANMHNPQDRLSFLKSINLNVDKDTYSEENILIPTEFSDVYENYNKLQFSAGYDLNDYKGKTVIKYTYTLLECEEETEVHLLCYGGKVIGGDICQTVLNGVMLPLK